MLTLRTHDTPAGVCAVARWRTPSGRTIEQRALVRYDELAGMRPSEVAGFGGKLGRLFRKAARARALRAVAKTAATVAKLTPYGAAAATALNVAKSAVRHAKRIREQGAQEVHAMAAPPASPRLPAREEARRERSRPAAELEAEAEWLTPRAQLVIARMLARDTAPSVDPYPHEDTHALR